MRTGGWQLWLTGFSRLVMDRRNVNLESAKLANGGFGWIQIYGHFKRMIHSGTVLLWPILPVNR